MGHIISVVQRKGGCGKTTIAVNVAACLAGRGYRVGFLDADPQASASTWGEGGLLPFALQALPLIGGDVRTWVPVVRDLADAQDILVIDAPPHIDEAVGAALALSDTVLMPCGASDLDIEGLKQTLVLANAVRRHHDLRVILVPNRVDGRTLEGRQIETELAALGEEVAPKVGDYTAFRRSVGRGLSASEVGSSRQAAADIDTLTDLVEAGGMARQRPAKGASLVLPRPARGLPALPVRQEAEVIVRRGWLRRRVG